MQFFIFEFHTVNSSLFCETWPITFLVFANVVAFLIVGITDFLAGDLTEDNLENNSDEVSHVESDEIDDSAAGGEVIIIEEAGNEHQKIPLTQVVAELQALTPFSLISVKPKITGKCG